MDENNVVTTISFNHLYENKDDEGSPTPFFEHIYSLHTSPQKTYLFAGYGQISGTEPYCVSHTLVIDHSKFSINKPLFKLGKAVKVKYLYPSPSKRIRIKRNLERNWS